MNAQAAVEALLELEQHHVQLCLDAGRPEVNSYTLAKVREALLALTGKSDHTSAANVSLDYELPLPVWGDLLTRDEYLTSVRLGVLTPSDGFGNPVLNGLYARWPVIPSNPDSLPSDATHVLWYNK